MEQIWDWILADLDMHGMDYGSLRVPYVEQWEWKGNRRVPHEMDWLKVGLASFSGEDCGTNALDLTDRERTRHRRLWNAEPAGKFKDYGILGPSYPVVQTGWILDSSATTKDVGDQIYLTQLETVWTGFNGGISSELVLRRSTWKLLAHVLPKVNWSWNWWRMTTRTVCHLTTRVPTPRNN